MTCKDPGIAPTELSAGRGTSQKLVNTSPLKKPRPQLQTCVLNASSIAKNTKHNFKRSLHLTRKRTHINETTSQQPKHSINGLKTKPTLRHGHVPIHYKPSLKERACPLLYSKNPKTLTNGSKHSSQANSAGAKLVLPDRNIPSWSCSRSTTTPTLHHLMVARSQPHGWPANPTLTAPSLT